MLKILAQLNKYFLRYLFYRAKIARFEKSSFKVTVTVLFKIKLQYLKIRLLFKKKNFFQNFRLSPALIEVGLCVVICGLIYLLNIDIVAEYE